MELYEFAHTGDEGQTCCSNIQSCLVEHGDGLSVSGPNLKANRSAKICLLSTSEGTFPGLAVYMITWMIWELQKSDNGQM